MILNSIGIRKSINKAFLKVKPNRAQIEVFKNNIQNLFDQIDESESEEFHKNSISKFLNDTYYSPGHYINTKGRADLVIHNGKDALSTVGVLVETKKPSNKTEMPANDNLNAKAFHELVLYFLRERITGKNLEIKHLVITNVYEWFVFDASEFDRVFAQNKKLVKQFVDFEEGRLSDTKTDFFYKQIADPFLEQLDTEISFTHFDLRDYEKIIRNNDQADDKKLVALFKFFSPENLLKLPFANDSNSLDKGFYAELLHIIGLQETREGGKKLIGRKAENDRDAGSLIENAITILKYEDGLSQVKAASYGANKDEQLYNVALELVITWINRILFLKLLEGQLVKYHSGDQSFRFLNSARIPDFDALNKLFFQVLAIRKNERNEKAGQEFANVPYLNSSLFEPGELEQKTIKISNLDDGHRLPLISSTVLKDQTGKRRSGELNSLEYLFAFLDAYDFTSEGAEEIQEENKTLINASVLGLIFEKINGYKDGAFFTPGFITMYMCRETIRRAVVQKFNEAKNWDCKTIEEVYNKIDDLKEANDIVNSLKICDPAVGSGHFLVSALNEIISIKNDLKILCDRKGKRLKEYHIEVVNDDLVVTDEDGDFFEYKPRNKESHRVQEALFHEKQIVIENCLFGVDINPNSVKICRLRLWVELLKNAYYKWEDGPSPFVGGREGELETLPNIDINIKCGNSLISRYALNVDIKKALKEKGWTVHSYRQAVSSYRNAKSKDEKRAMEELILKIKQQITSEIRRNDPLKTRYDKLAHELYNRFTGNFLFEPEGNYDKKTTALVKKGKVEKEKIEKEMDILSSKMEEIKNNRLFRNSFEWRFEFPEALNEEGEFIGFDVVIGNPPYIRVQNLDYQEIDYYKNRFNSFYQKSDIYLLFIEHGLNLLKSKGHLTFINPTLFMSSAYGKGLRDHLSGFQIIEIVDFGDLPIFEEAITYTGIFTIRKSSPSFFRYKRVSEMINIATSLSTNKSDHISQSSLGSDSWILRGDTHSMIVHKIKSFPSLSNYATINSGCFTGYDVAFFVDDKTILDNNLEIGIIKPVIMGKEPKKYLLQEPQKECIYPYQLNDKNETVLIEETVLRHDYPNVYKYLFHFKDNLEQRKDSRKSFKEMGRPWYSYTRKGLVDIFNNTKILVGYIVSGNTYCLDKQGYMFSVGRVFAIYPNDSEDNNFYLGILNSNVSEYLMKTFCPIKQGGFYKISSEYLNSFPIPGSSSEKSEISELVEEIVAAKLKNNNSQVLKLEEKLNDLVYAMYGLTGEEIRTIEEALK